MKTIDLQKEYPEMYCQPTLLTVTDEVEQYLVDSRKKAHAAREQLRYNKAYYSLDLMLEEGIDLPDHHSLEEDAEATLLRKELVHFIQESLPEKERERILLFLNGYTVTQIAEKQGVDKSTVSKSIKMAQIKIQAFLKLYK